ncbi:uncharacterized protein G2W53_003443 [Senna tora]|uniref:Uncharacterized protein n=1 Tax=Senna tora TaxID=362788 RepID=A0A834XAL3_9FABA|nr:uncharacterized protein G2W53_003443 [Senna tora]
MARITEAGDGGEPSGGGVRIRIGGNDDEDYQYDG